MMELTLMFTRSRRLGERRSHAAKGSVTRDDGETTIPWASREYSLMHFYFNSILHHCFVWTNIIFISFDNDLIHI